VEQIGPVSYFFNLMSIQFTWYTSWYTPVPSPSRAAYLSAFGGVSPLFEVKLRHSACHLKTPLFRHLKTPHFDTEVFSLFFRSVFLFSVLYWRKCWNGSFAKYRRSGKSRERAWFFIRHLVLFTFQATLSLCVE